MYNSNIQGLLNSNPIDLIKSYQKADPASFDKDILTLSDKGESFFVTLLRQGYTDEFYIELLDLITSRGYDFKKSVKFLPDEKIKLNKDKKEYLPEFMNILTFCRNDLLISKFAEKLGKEYFLDLEKDGWFVLESLYSRALPKSINVVSNFGLSYENPPSGNSLLRIAERIPELTDLYWSYLVKSDDEDVLNDKQFNHFRSIFEQKCSQIHSKSDYQVSEVNSQLEVKLPKLNTDQKLELLEASVLSKELSPLRKICKSLGIKSTDEIVQIATLKRPNEIKNKELLNPIISNPNLFVKKINRVRLGKDGCESIEDYGIDLFQKCLQSFSFNPYDKYGNGRQNLSNVAIRDKLSKTFDLNTIINTKSVDGKNIFNLLIDRFNDQKLKKNSLFGMLNVLFNRNSKLGLYFNTITGLDVDNIRNNKVDSLTEIQVEEVNNFLNKTWRSNGGVFHNMSQEVVSTMLVEKFFILDRIFLESQNIFTKEEKVHIFSQVVNAMCESSWLSRVFENPEKFMKDLPNSNESFHEITFKVLVQDLLVNPTKDILKLNLSNETVEKIQDTKFYSILQSLMLKESLASDLSENAPKVKKLKI